MIVVWFLAVVWFMEHNGESEGGREGVERIDDEGVKEDVDEQVVLHLSCLVLTGLD